MTTGVNLPVSLETGTYTTKKSSIGGLTLSESDVTHYGIPSVMTVDDIPGMSLCGVYWHNNFGNTAVNTPIEMSAIAARFIYSIAEDKFLINVI